MPAWSWEHLLINIQDRVEDAEWCWTTEAASPPSVRLRGFAVEPSHRCSSCADVSLPQEVSVDKMRWRSGLLGIGGTWEFVSRALVQPAAASQTAVLGDSAEMSRRPWTQQSHSPGRSFLPVSSLQMHNGGRHFSGFANAAEMILDCTFVSVLKPRLTRTKENRSPTWELQRSDRPCACWVHCCHGFTVTQWRFENRDVHQPADGARPSTGRTLLQNTWLHVRRTDEANWHSDKGANLGFGGGGWQILPCS